MKIVNIKFLGTDYAIQCQDDEVAKIKNLEARLNNRMKSYAKKNYNFTDTHKLLIVALSLEDKINDLLINQKKLIEINDNNNKRNKILTEEISLNNNLKDSLDLISQRIKNILKKILSDNRG